LFVEENKANYKQDIKGNEDVFAVMNQNKESLPPIRFDCGINDLLIEHNRVLHHKLTKAKIDHNYQEFEGSHKWKYWQDHIKDTFLFFNDLC